MVKRFRASSSLAPWLNPPRSSWKDSPAAQLRPLHLYGAYVLLIMGAVSALSGFLQRSAPDMTAQPIFGSGGD